MSLIPKREWLVWSNEHRAWWRPERCGYTSDVGGAGLYTEEEADECCESRSKIAGEEAPEIKVHIREIGKGAEKRMELSGEITRLTRQVETLQFKYDFAQQEGSRLIGERDALKAELADAKKANEACHYEHERTACISAGRNDIIEELKGKLAAKEGDIEDLYRQVVALKAQLTQQAEVGEAYRVEKEGEIERLNKNLEIANRTVKQFQARQDSQSYHQLRASKEFADVEIARQASTMRVWKEEIEHQTARAEAAESRALDAEAKVKQMREAMRGIVGKRLSHSGYCATVRCNCPPEDKAFYAALSLPAPEPKPINDVDAFFAGAPEMPDPEPEPDVAAEVIWFAKRCDSYKASLSLAVEALEKIAGGNVEPGVLPDSLLMAGKAAFTDRMFTWCQETARGALSRLRACGKDGEGA